MKGKEKSVEKTKVNSSQGKSGDRHPEFETPSQRRNRDGVGRGQSGSDGSANKGRGSNH